MSKYYFDLASQPFQLTKINHIINKKNTHDKQAQIMAALFDAINLGNGPLVAGLLQFVKCPWEKYLFFGEVTSIIHRAALVGRPSILKIILDDPIMININLPGHNNQTPLMTAIYNKNLEAINILLDNGADYDTSDINGHTALMYAVMISYPDSIPIVKALLDAGADIQLVDKGGNTAVYYAGKYGSPKTVQFMEDYDDGDCDGYDYDG